MNSVPKKNGPTWEAVLAFGDKSQVFVGIDEVGRGAWAGPVVAAAVILPFGLDIDGVNDSKKLSPLRRRAVDRKIRRHALAIGIGWVHAHEVDTLGLAAAIILSGTRAIDAIDTTYDNVLLDGSDNYLQASHNSASLVRGDSILPQVAAASIIAKVARDRYVERLDVTFPNHKFANHKGYGTAIHSQALAEFGVTKHHRLSYKPIRVFRNVD